MVAAHWLKVLAAEAYGSRSLGVVLERSVTVSRTKGTTLALASVVGSSMVV
jgi:hypothetical protein